jgi:hypothetical protein
LNTDTVKTPRDFTYIKPRKRRLSEYEAVTCFTQPDPEAFDKQGWYLRTAEGRTAWRRESTRLRHPSWFDFRDPASHWQRTYVRMQAEQERAIERAVEDAGHAKASADVDRKWMRDLVFGHYRTWAFHEYGLFRCFAQAQRETLSDTLGNVFCFAGVDRMRHAQAIVLYVMDLESQLEGMRDEGAKERWLSDPAYQPARRLTEELMAVDDWAELAVAVNLVVDPIVSALATGELLHRHGPLHGDSLTPFLISTTERDRRRNRDWTDELVRMVTADGVPAREENRAAVQEWIDRWTPRALEAAAALAPIHAQIPLRILSFEEAMARCRATQAEIVGALGFRAGDAR